MAQKKARPISKEHHVDWQLIHQHLDEAKARLQSVDQLSREELEAAWARRATQLAVEIQQEDTGEQLELVIVQIGREQYGVEVNNVHDIRPLQVLTRVPRVPGWVAGVVNLRGRILSVLSLAAYLGLPPAEHDQDAPPLLMLVETPQMELALLVDDVLSVEPVPLARIQEATGSTMGIHAEYVRGLLVRDGQKMEEENDMLVILDLPALLADPGLIVHEEVV